MTYDSREYESSVHYLYSLQKYGIKLGLKNTFQIMNILGEPHRSFHSVHIAGTNGKGSTAAALSSILIEHGLRIGMFTSPHLVSFTERISINNRRILESEVIELTSRIRNTIGDSDIKPTFFEIVTAMAFCYFAERNVDWAVIETGMGGRLDATNVLHPAVSIITNISHDHCEFLGSTLSDIAFEKAGIIKQNVPVITASRQPEVIRELEKSAASQIAELHIYGRDFQGTLVNMTDRQITFDYHGYEHFEGLTAPLTGEYQLFNMCTTVRACELLRRQGLSVSDLSIRNGLRNIRIEGRLEWLSHEPPLLIDSAHNPEAAASLAESVTKLFSGKYIILVVGIMGDKNMQGILRPLIEVASHVIVTKAKYERAASPEALEKALATIMESERDIRPPSVRLTKSVREALDLAKSMCVKDHIILVTGSFYTTGEVKELLGCNNLLSGLREYK